MSTKRAPQKVTVKLVEVLHEPFYIGKTAQFGAMTFIIKSVQVGQVSIKDGV